MKWLLTALISFPLFSANNRGCPQIDPNKKYPDGIPYCPESVQTNAFTVTRCAFDQANDWHASTKTEESLMNHLVDALKAGNAAEISANTSNLKLQVCRSKTGEDSFLLMYTKPGIKNYSGPFLMYREGGKDSGLVLHAPHDGQDGTPRDTRDAFQNSNALALISNGHKRTLSGRGGRNHDGAYPSDWAHTRADLGYTAFLAFKNKFPESVHIHIHGLAKNEILVTDSVGWDAPHTLRSAFIDAARKALGNRPIPVKEWRFNGWITGLAMTMNENGKGRDANQRWVGTEFSVKLHAETRVLTETIINLEADYLNKPRPIALDTITPIPPDADDVVDVKELETVPAEQTAEKLSSEEDGPIYAYAPIPKGNTGTKKLACVGISYTNPVNNFVTAPQCQKTANQTAAFFAFNSRNKLMLIPKGYHMNYPGEAWASWEKAELVAKKQFDANYYIIPSIFRKGGNHASNGIAHVIQLTGWVVNHEVGHLTGLGHTGIYTYDKKTGKPILHQYEDNDSVMGNMGSKYLTAPQYYNQAWMNRTEAALYEPGIAFELTKITTLPLTKKPGPLFTVKIPSPSPQGKNSFFVAYPKRCDQCIGLYMGGGGGSQLIATFKTEFYDEIFTHLHYKIIASSKTTVTLVIDDAPKPAAMMQSIEVIDENKDEPDQAAVLECDL